MTKKDGKFSFLYRLTQQEHDLLHFLPRTTQEYPQQFQINTKFPRSKALVVYQPADEILLYSALRQKAEEHLRALGSSEQTLLSQNKPKLTSDDCTSQTKEVTAMETN
jgi:hypothetical protein